MFLRDRYPHHPLFTDPNFTRPDYAGPRTILLKSGLLFPDWFFQFYKGVPAFEERLLYYAAYALAPQTNVVYMVSNPIDPDILQYMLSQVATATGVDMDTLLRRFTFFSLDDNRNSPYDGLLVQNQEKMAELESLVTNPATTYMDQFNANEDTQTICDRLGIPWTGNVPEMLIADQKSENRRLFKEFGIQVPPGVEDCFTLSDVFEAWKGMGSREGKYLLKANTGDGGLGVVRVHVSGSPRSVDEFIECMQFNEQMTREFTEQLLAEVGGSFEIFIDAKEKVSPSVQYMIHANGAVELLSTHDQLVNTDGEYRGGVFPASDEYRQQLVDSGAKLVAALAQRGVRDRLSVDYLLTRNSPDEPWNVYATELNIRKSGTTHPREWTRLLTKAEYDPADNFLHTPDGREVYYISTEHGYLQPKYVDTPLSDFLKAADDVGLLFDHETKEGVYFHLLTNRPIGKVNFTAIGFSPERAQHFYDQFFAILGDSTHL